MPEEIVEPETPLFTEEELGNIRSIKLNNGNDILAVILSTDTTLMVVKRPCIIMKLVTDETAISYMLVKWQPYSLSENHIIYINSIVSYCRVNADFMEFYVKSVQNQINEENKTTAYQWPKWMDKVDKSKVN
jgi:hypothetical protein